MVKGLTRRIIEVRQTNSIYFEKAVFYCRVDLPKSTRETTLTQEAQRIVESLCCDMPRRARPAGNLKIAGLLRFLLSAAAGAVLAMILFRFHF